MFAELIMFFKKLKKYVLTSLDTAGIYLLNVNERNTKTKETPERRHWGYWHLSDVFIINFEHISHLILLFLLLTLNL